MKPITTFGYDSILFVDDNKIEELRLKMIFKMTKGKLKKCNIFYWIWFLWWGYSIG